MKLHQFDQYSGICIIEKNISYTYEELAAQIRRYSEELDAKIQKGDIICIKSDYSFYCIALLLALSQKACIIVPIVPTTDSEFQNKISAASVHKIISLNNSILEIIKLEFSESDTYDNYKTITEHENSGLVLFSSGTTGAPKVMVHNFTDLIEKFEKPKKIRNLNFLLFLLFDHIGGINTLLNCLNSGAEITIPTNRNPEYILNLIQEKKVQILPTTPTFLNLMLMTENFEEFDLSSLKMITYGTERMPQTLLNKVKEKIPNVKFLQTFGTSETGIMKTESKSSTSLFFRIVDSDYEHKIIDSQLYLKSKTQVKGYVNHDSSQFAEDGWFATGDLVESDDDGFIKIIGRINNIINVGGQKVLPKEVEDIIAGIPEIIDVTVYAKKNIITGEMVCADIVIRDGLDPNQIKSKVLQKCKAELDKYKVPSKISVSNSIAFSSRFKKTK